MKKTVIILGVLIIVIVGAFIIYTQTTKDESLLPEKSTYNSTVETNKSCINNNDCGLDMCTGCFNKEYLDSLGSSLPCTTYSDTTCACENNTCKEVANDIKNNMWICDGKEWIKQGIPTDPQPTEPCTAENSAFPKKKKMILNTFGRK